jgi:hypothetical protein
MPQMDNRNCWSSVDSVSGLQRHPQRIRTLASSARPLIAREAHNQKHKLAEW